MNDVLFSISDSGWSHHDVGLCGQRTFLRPCQGTEDPDAQGVGYPLHPTCKSAEEKVYIVDSDEFRRVELAERVAQLGHSTLHCGSAQEFHEAIGPKAAGVALLNIGPLEDGLSIHEWIIGRQLPIGVVYISHGVFLETAIHCLKIGALDILQWPVSSMTLRSSLREAIAVNRPLFCAKQGRSVASHLLALLTPSELHVANLIAKGYTINSIAQMLNRSVHTIKIHKKRISIKFNARTSASIANIVNLAS